MSVADVRRLPGVAFEVQSPQPAEVLPRMDVAVFVGFASSGPLHLPVAVEDGTEFTKIFGPDAALAWDEEGGAQLHAYLGPAVRAFFQNGGTRCWVIRVADEGTACSNLFEVPGLKRAIVASDGTVEEVTSAFARARSEGSWSDKLLVGSALVSHTVNVVQVPMQVGRNDKEQLCLTIILNPASAKDVERGDLLRLTFEDEGYTLIMPVQSIEKPNLEEIGSPLLNEIQGRTLLQVKGDLFLWFKNGELSSPLTADLTSESEDDSSTESPEDLESPPQVFPASVPACEILSFDLWIRSSGRPIVKLENLGFAPGHRFFWGALPTDMRLYSQQLSQLNSTRPELWDAVAEPRFPLAGPSDDEELSFSADSGWRNADEEGGDAPRVIYFPSDMAFIPIPSVSPSSMSASALERDGLANFEEKLFLDEDIISSRMGDLMSGADFIRYQSPEPRRLRGIYAALEIEEATMLAIPDAVHRGWSRSDPEKPVSPVETPPMLRPQWWHFLDCDANVALPLTRQPVWGNFLDCGTRVIDAPTLDDLENPIQSNSFTLAWSEAADPDATYVLEEAADPEFVVTEVVYTGPETQFTIYGKGAGRYYFHVRVQIGSETSDWSEGIVAELAPPPPWTLTRVEKYDSDALLSLHRAAMRMSAARGDLLAVLALPSHFREEESIRYVSTLKSSVQTDDSSGTVQPLGYDELPALSYAAVYHPWPIALDEIGSGSNLTLPPDGAACGVMAKRSILRGAWVAPANEPINGIVSLAPRIGSMWHLRFQNEQVNLLQQAPRGFVCMNSDTLSAEEDLRAISVRRLLILLRRLALRLGASYVFEPNSEAFQRRVQRGFEAMLQYMYERGAFKGSTPDASFQVVTDSTINTPQSMEQGRFIVELRVAPSLPMRFLTIRLIQSGDRTLVALEG